jgi:uncharacterized protein (DUF1778 family)
MSARVAERAGPSGARRGTTINLRVEPETRELIDTAAAALGKSRTEFMVESARSQAVDVLLDRRLFALDPDAFDGFVRALEGAPAPGAKLRKLMRRQPVWAPAKG